jgi:hypothetical protein
MVNTSECRRGVNDALDPSRRPSRVRQAIQSQLRHRRLLLVRVELAETPPRPDKVRLRVAGRSSAKQRCAVLSLASYRMLLFYWYELPPGMPGFIKRRDFPHVKFCAHSTLWNIRPRTINQLVRNFRSSGTESRERRRRGPRRRLLRSAFLRPSQFAPLAIVGLAIVGPAQLLHVHVVGPSDLP